VPLHDTQYKYGAKNWGELVYVVIDNLSNFQAGKELLRSGAFGDQPLCDREFIPTEWFLHRCRGTRRQTAAPHESGVYYDSREPCRELRTAFKVFQVSKGAKQTILQGIFCVFGVSQDAQGGMKE
jgi:hypothetical protein